MASLFVDTLESRRLLSGVGDDYELAVDPGISEAGVMMPMSAPTRAASTVKKGFYSGKTTLDEKKGSLILQVSSVSTTAFSGTFKSADWGAFSVTVTGKISSGAVTFSGKNSYTQIKSFKGTISGSTLSGKLSIVQNGLSVSGNFTGIYAKTSPAMGNVIEPKMLGSYAIKSSDNNRTKSMVISKQVDGKVWGKLDGSAITGVILSDGAFKVIMKESDGKALIMGKLKSSKMSGEWEWYGNNGDTESGTFTGTRK